jgi:hypothetical protein
MINARQFAQFWSEYFDKKAAQTRNWQKKWEESKGWTDFMLDYDMLIEEVAANFDGLRLEFEYRKIDVCIYSANTYKNINYYDNSDKDPDTLVPIGLEVMLEHENDYRMVFQEIRKLIEFKAKLKVLVTYPEGKPGGEPELAIREKLSKAIAQSNKFIPEDPQTQYLIITGYLEDDYIHWNNFICEYGSGWKVLKL